MIVPLMSPDLERLSGRVVDTVVRGWAWWHGGRAVAALPLQSLGGEDWGTDGIVGSVPNRLAAARLVEHAVNDLRASGARLFIAFAELPGLREAGTVRLLESPGRKGEPRLATHNGDTSDEFAQLVARTQKDAIDFPEIPPADHVLDSYLGHGCRLWRSWRGEGVVLVNPVDNATCHLAFVGITPRFRGKGHGQKLVTDALYLTGPEKKLTVAVDTRNEAAIAIYDKLEFTTTGERPVHFRQLRP